MPDRRTLTAAVRRRAWGELGVRPWTSLALLLAVTAAVLAVAASRDWRREKRVIETGTPVVGEVVGVGSGVAARQGSRDEVLDITLHYMPPTSTSPLESGGRLARKPGTSVSLKDKLNVRIDPDRPEYWTERTEPPPWGLAMITPLLCGGIAIACGLLAAVKRFGVLRAYATAEPRRATVVSVRQSPLAPFSKLVGVTLDDFPHQPADRRVRDCYWPNRAGAIHPKQPLDVLVAKRRTFAAVAYDVPGSAAHDVLG